MPSQCKCGGNLVIADHTYPNEQSFFEAQCSKCGIKFRQGKRMPKKRG